MNSSPESSSSEEIVFVPLMIDESSPASPRLRSSRRKPKHPQKISQKPQRQYERQSSGYSSEHSSGEHSSSEQSSEQTSSECDFSSGELSYNDLTADFSDHQFTSTKDLFLPAPNGDGYYILTTTQTTTTVGGDDDEDENYDGERHHVEKGRVDGIDEDEDDDGGFSILENSPLNESISGDEEGEREYGAHSRFSSAAPPKLKILTMEMRQDGDGGDRDDDEDDDRSRHLVERSVGDVNGQLSLVESEMIKVEHDYIPCPLCDRLFDDETRMKRHRKLAHGPKSFSCPECAKSFTQYGHMQVHLRTVHTSAKPFECKVCQRKFNVSSNRNRHQRLHFTKGSLHFVPALKTFVMTDGKEA